MFCSNCGKELEQGAAFCPNCGESAGRNAAAVQEVPAQPVSAPSAEAPAQPVSAPSAETTASQSVPAPSAEATAQPPVLSRRQFYKLSKGSRSMIKAAAIISYICAGCTLLFSLLGVMYADVGPFILIDVVLVVGFALGFHLGRSRACAILLLAYAIYNCVYMLLTTGQFTGYFILIAGGLAVAGTFRFAGEWKKYRASMLPPDQK